MTYQDYLPDTPYADLPAAVQAEIARAEYEALRDATAVMAAPPVMPNSLRTAFRARTQPVVAVPAASTGMPWRVAAVLGWGLLVLGAFWWLRQTPDRVIEYRDSPPPPAQVVVRYDTVSVEVVQRIERIRTVRDTVYVARVSPPIVRVDTVRAPLVAPPSTRSRSVADGPDWRALTVGGSILSESE